MTGMWFAFIHLDYFERRVRQNHRVSFCEYTFVSALVHREPSHLLFVDSSGTGARNPRRASRIETAVHVSTSRRVAASRRRYVLSRSDVRAPGPCIIRTCTRDSDRFETF